MVRRAMRRALLLLLLLMGVAGNHAVAASPRLALVMGNAGYDPTLGWDRLPVVAKDVELMARVLTDLGFKVMVAKELTRDGIRDAVLMLKDALAHGDGRDVVAVYFSGHGLGIGGRNYLVPLGADITSQRAEVVHDMLFPVERILAEIGEAPGRLNLLFLDACRSDPTVKGHGPKGAPVSVAFGGILPPEAYGTIVAYATRPGSASYTGGEDATASFYTGALAGHLVTPGLSLAQVLARTELSVRELSRGQQLPTSEGSDALKALVLRPPRDDGDETAWGAARQEGTVAAYQRYAEERPGGRHVSEAAVELARLARDARQEAAVQPPLLSPVIDGRAEPAVGVYPTPGSTFRDRFTDGRGEGPEMVVVPAGDFMMGSPPDEPERYGDEGPQRRVTIGQAFAVGRYEVTFAEWDACLSDGGCKGYRPKEWGWGRGHQPVITVSWEDAQAYVSWLSGRTGRVYRLLSEAEWEYAARAGTTTPFSTGRVITTAQANFDGNYTYNGSSKGTYRHRTVNVGSFPPNPFGLYDMQGNVREWVEDCYGPYTMNLTDGRTNTTEKCPLRVLRGGSWNDIPGELRSAYRSSSAPVARYFTFGFRVARILTP